MHDALCPVVGVLGKPVGDRDVGGADVGEFVGGDTVGEYDDGGV